MVLPFVNQMGQQNKTNPGDAYDVNTQSIASDYGQSQNTSDYGKFIANQTSTPTNKYQCVRCTKQL